VSTETPAFTQHHDPHTCVDCVNGKEEFHVPIPTPEVLWAHIQRVELCVTMLAAVMAALAVSPFGAMIPPELRAEIDRVNSL